MAIANRDGAYDLGIVAMGVVFQGLPGAEIWGRLAGFLWYFLLFIAGVTSCVALASPAIAFLQDEFKMAAQEGRLLLIASLGFVPRRLPDDGVQLRRPRPSGTSGPAPSGLVVFATLEIILFVWVFGMPTSAWEELHHGADLRIPIGLQIHHEVRDSPRLFCCTCSWAGGGVTQAVPDLPDHNDRSHRRRTSLYALGGTPRRWRTSRIVVAQPCHHHIDRCWSRNAYLVQKGLRSRRPEMTRFADRFQVSQHGQPNVRSSPSCLVPHDCSVHRRS